MRTPGTLLVQLFAAGLLLAGTGCGREPEPAALYMLADRDVESLDPHDDGGLFQTTNLLANAYEGLIRRDADMKLHPALATSWSNPDDLTWDFVLRSGVHFHDGTPLTAEAVVASLRRASARSAGVARGALANVVAIEAVAKDVVRLRTREPDASLLSLLPQVFVASPRWLQAAANATDSGGSGPYRVTARQAGRFVALARFDGYWGPTPTLTSVQVLAGRFGDTEAEARVPPGAAATFYALPGTPVFERARRHYTLHQRPGLSVQYLGFDLRERASPGVRLPRGTHGNPFRDPRVRRAIALAIDYEALRHAAFAGRGRSEGQLVPPTVLGYDPALPRPRGDPGEARRLMAATPWRDGFEVDLDARALVSQYASRLAADLAPLGIRVQVRQHSEDAFFATLREGRSSLYLLRYSCRTGDAQDLFDNVLHSRDEAHDLGAFNFSADRRPVPGLDESIVAARRELDPARRLARLRELMGQAMEQQLMVPLLSEPTLVFLSPEIGWRPRADGLRLFAEMFPRPRP
ncbi:MAG: ABC transporter substrate-binding protein [Vicinamibacteria bacterium]|nr:ABC transporter substrate-binding protein [Vicinamibacteria bacterium]